MRVQLSLGDWRAVAPILKRGMPSRTAANAGVHLEAAGETLTATVHNGSAWRQVRLPATVHEPGARLVTFPAHLKGGRATPLVLEQRAQVLCW